MQGLLGSLHLLLHAEDTGQVEHGNGPGMGDRQWETGHS